MKCLVTGGAGFIGSHLCEKLLHGGDEVIAFDDLSTGKIDNIVHLLDHPHFHFIKGSILDINVLKHVMKTVHEVYHLASVVGVSLVLEKPVHGVRVNLTGTENVLDIATEYGCKLLITSSSEVYGRNTAGIFHEDDPRLYGPPSMTRWSYASAKSMSEFSALARVKEHKLHVVIARLFNTVGPRQSSEYGMVLPRFITMAHTGMPLTVYGSGKQARCFVWVGDVVKALVALLRNDHTAGEIYNIGSTESITIEECARKVIHITGSPSLVTFVPYETAYPEGFEEIMCRVPNISKVEQAIGFAPSYSLDQIITKISRETLENFRYGT